MQVANSITLTETHLKKQAIPELGISRTHTHTPVHTHPWFMSSGECFSSIPRGSEKEVGPHRSLSGRPSVYTSSFSAAGLHLPLSLTWYFSSKCSQARKPLEDNPIQKKNSIFRFLTSPFSAGCIATGQWDSCYIADELKKGAKLRFKLFKLATNCDFRRYLYPQQHANCKLWGVGHHSLGIWPR